jgi:hypothetical protein
MSAQVATLPCIIIDLLIFTMIHELHNLMKGARERGNITRFSSSIHSFTEVTARDDYEHYKGLLHEALEHMLNDMCSS